MWLSVALFNVTVAKPKAFWNTRANFSGHSTCRDTCCDQWQCSLPVTLEDKAILLQALTGPEGFRSWSYLILRQSTHAGGKVVSPTHRPPLPQEVNLVLNSVRSWVDSRAIVRPDGLCQWKILMTPSGIDPATFRFVAQCLNHCTTACPWELQW
jgi:hypothetical protein